MDENITNSNSEVSESQTEGIENEVSGADDDDWDSIVWGADDGADAEEDGESEESPVSAEPEADQPKDGAKQEPEKAAEPAETEPETKAEGEDQSLELKYMGQSKKVSREEAVTLAQKGLDYDRIRGERDRLNEESRRLKEYEGFLNELKGDFPNIEAMMTDTRARMIAEKENIPYADAVAKAKLLHPEQKQAETKTADQPKANDAVQKFLALYPGVKAEEIPQSVWDEVKKTGDLAGAYGKYERQKQADEIASLKNKIATLEQNQKNAARSPGSASSSGKTNSKSLIQQMWEEDDY